MWPWQHSVPKRTALWIKLVSISCGLHLVILFLMLVTYRGYYGQLNISIQPRTNAPIILMPLHKRVQTVNAQGAKKTGVHGLAHKTTQGVEKNAAVVNQPTHKKTPTMLASAGRNTKKKRRAQRDREARKQKQQQKKKSKNKQGSARKEIKKQNVKAQNQKKKSKKETPKPVPAEPIKEQIPVQEPIQPAVQQEQPQELPVSMATHESAGTAQNNDAIYVGQVEWEALQVQEYIQQELEGRWKPPVGLADGAGCQIKVLVDWEGAIKEVKVAESSGVLTYDIHARNTVLAMQFPKVAWGKELVVHFK